MTSTGKPVEARLTLADGRAVIDPVNEATIEAGQELGVTFV